MINASAGQPLRAKISTVVLQLTTSCTQTPIKQFTMSQIPHTPHHETGDNGFKLIPRLQANRLQVLPTKTSVHLLHSLTHINIYGRVLRKT